MSEKTAPYQDPEDSNEVLRKLHEFAKNEEHENIKILMDETFPGWIISSLQNYSEDYPHLKVNWAHICDKQHVEPKFIVIVDYIDFSTNHTIIKEFCEIMTQVGYCVRRKEEFSACSVCGLAIPAKKLWSQFKHYDIPCPKSWSKKCQKC